MHRSLIPRSLGALALVVFASGCALLQPPSKLKPKQKPLVPQPPVKNSYWNAEAVTGEPAIVINLSEQRAHFFRNENEIAQSPISSGKRGFETATGSFKVVQLDKNHASNLYGEYVNASGGVVQSNVDVNKNKRPEGASFRGAKMPFFLRFNGGIGMHAGKLPGYPASHGCVRMPRTMAEHFFASAPIGTPVTVTGSARTRPSSDSPAKKANAKPAKSAPKKPPEPAQPDATAPPAPAPESAPKVEPAPEKTPEPAAPAPAPAGA